MIREARPYAEIKHFLRLFLILLIQNSHSVALTNRLSDSNRIGNL
jgi:hypothetical protein